MVRKSVIPALLLAALVIPISSCAPPGEGAGLATSDAGAISEMSAEPEASTAAPTVVTPKIVPTASQTYTPAPAVSDLTFTKNAFCRRGPSVRYFDVGSFNQGDTAQAVGRNDTDPRWWFVRMSNGKELCWISATTVQSDAEAELLPVRQPEKPLPQTPADLYADRICKQTGFAVTLNWTRSWDADGYYVYLNGELIQEITNPAQTSYVIKLPMNQPVTYALEAYNRIGYGEQMIIYDPGCP